MELGFTALDVRPGRGDDESSIVAGPTGKELPDDPTAPGAVAVRVAVPGTSEAVVKVRLLGPTGPVDLNTAEAAELERLPGIGPVLSARIIAERRRSGPFRSVDELSRVPGISQEVIERLRRLVVAGG